MSKREILAKNMKTGHSFNESSLHEFPRHENQIARKYVTNRHADEPQKTFKKTTSIKTYNKIQQYINATLHIIHSVSMDILKSVSNRTISSKLLPQIHLSVQVCIIQQLVCVCTFKYNFSTLSIISEQSVVKQGKTRLS